MAGCSKKPVSKDELRAVTSEVTAAAQKIAGRNSRIEVRPQPASGAAGIPAGPGVDDIYISLGDPGEGGAIRSAIDEIAKRHGLSVNASTSGSVARYDYSLNGAQTHTIHVVTPLGPRAAVRRAPVKPLTPHARSGGPRLAIIIDDNGYDRAEDDAALALNFPVTPPPCCLTCSFRGRSRRRRTGAAIR